ncbi:hypothetical protein BDA99DRAFT_558587 [Phascolomyces articulosus]|uniref:Cyclin N-terminal domain-containing protein n=1 Tax=Phascolomyces articulosus TaxID=60185 RepID=A0AAD5K2C4_9FUNG|nr:hypothetical protein BDA99DRAFT_558587 [Phascolomyces articulosus]
MPSRSFSVPYTTSLALQGSIDVPAPTLPVPLMLEIRDALPALEKALAPELSAQCLPLCMQLLSTWVLVSSTGSQCEQYHHHGQEKTSITTSTTTTTRSMTRSKFSRWFTQSFARKKGVVPITDKDISENHDDYFDLVHKIDDYEDYGYHYDNDNDTTTRSSIHSTTISSEVDQQVNTNNGHYANDEEDEEQSDDDDGKSSTFAHSQNTDEKYQHGLPQSLTKRSISSFLNRLGMSVRKAIVGKQQHHEKLALPSPVLEEDHITRSVTINKDWDDEHIWAPRDTAPPPPGQQHYQHYRRIEANKREKKANASLSSLKAPTSTMTAVAATTTTNTAVKASKTDMDVCREQSVPFIKIGLGRRHQEIPNQNVDVEDAQQYRLSSTSFDLRWQERFHEQQHDKIDMTLRSVSGALYEIISHNHAFGLFDYDESFIGSPLLQPDSSEAMQELFMAHPVTTWHDIYEQMAYVFDCGELTTEHAIITYIYVSRMLEKSEQSLCDVNWRLILLAGMLLAVKVWDDCAVYNMDFVQIFPELDIKVINMIERRFMMAMDWDVSCKCSIFAKTYFDLREFASTRTPLL